MDPGDDPKRLALRSSEDLYDVAARYGFARRFVGGRSVLDVHWGEIGYGPAVLCETAESVEAVSNLPESAVLASKAYPAPNVSYLGAALPRLPYPDGSFEVVLAFGVLEKLDRPEELVTEIVRVLKPGGTLLAATPDKQANSNERALRDQENRGEMYVGELGEMLERCFGNVLLYRQGSVVGGAVFRDLGSPGILEGAEPRLSVPNFGEDPPATRFVLAVCGGAAEAGYAEPYVVLDRDRGVFEEREDLAEDARLFRAEALRMQETEVQTFQDALKLQRSEIAFLEALRVRLENQLESRNAGYESLKSRHEDLKAHYQTRKANHERLHKRYQALKEQHEKLESKSAALESRSAALEGTDAEVRTRVVELGAQRDALQRRLQEMEASGTWRLFAPYRRLRARLSRKKGGR